MDNKKKQNLTIIVGCILFWVGMSMVLFDLMEFWIVPYFYAISSAVIGIYVALMLQRTYPLKRHLKW